mgnify:CR=1 FL=1
MAVTAGPGPSREPELSVLVPAFRRPLALARCLDHLAAQAGAGAFEVVVVIDGEEDYAEADLERRAREFPVPLLWRQGPHRGHAAALNQALRLARASRVLVIGDDIFAGPEMVARHVERLRDLGDPRAAVQGKVVWHPEMLPDPFLDWDRRAGALFGFSALDHELFTLLGGHAATAVFAARLYSQSERKLNTIQGFIDLLTK